MQINDIRVPFGAKKRRKVVGRGRGSGHGKTSTRGHKGQRAREGRNVNAASEGGQVRLLQRLPKVGFNPHRPKRFQIVNVVDLNRFGKDAVVSASSLKEKQLISTTRVPVKILGTGELKKALVVQVDRVSKSAQEKITSAGGKVELPQAQGDSPKQSGADKK
jgi:large subunit ribosomal protein L15